MRQTDGRKWMPPKHCVIGANAHLWHVTLFVSFGYSSLNSLVRLALLRVLSAILHMILICFALAADNPKWSGSYWQRVKLHFWWAHSQYTRAEDCLGFYCILLASTFDSSNSMARRIVNPIRWTTHHCALLLQKKQLVVHQSTLPWTRATLESARSRMDPIGFNFHSLNTATLQLQTVEIIHNTWRQE